VTITAELTEVDGRRLEFNIKVEDEKGLLGEGTHQRYIIDPERFMAKLG
jgi:predicted thioesterase